MVARIATVSPVPSAMTKVAATPASSSPCDSAKTRMMIAPEHGRMPTARIADHARTSQLPGGRRRGTARPPRPRPAPCCARRPARRGRGRRPCRRRRDGVPRDGGDGRHGRDRGRGGHGHDGRGHDARRARHRRRRSMVVMMVMVPAAKRLRPQEPQAEEDDRRVARDLQPVGHPGHLLRGRADDQRRHADDDDRRQRLDEGGGEGDGDAPLHAVARGEHVGGDHRLAVARAGGMEDAVEEGDAEEQPHRRAVLLDVAERVGEAPVELRLPRRDPGEGRAERPAHRHAAAAVGRGDAERALAARPRRLRRRLGRGHLGRRAGDGEHIRKAVRRRRKVGRQLALVARQRIQHRHRLVVEALGRMIGRGAPRRRAAELQRLLAGELEGDEIFRVEDLERRLLAGRDRQVERQGEEQRQPRPVMLEPVLGRQR